MEWIVECPMEFISVRDGGNGVVNISRKLIIVPEFLGFSTVSLRASEFGMQHWEWLNAPFARVYKDRVGSPALRLEILVYRNNAPKTIKVFLWKEEGYIRASNDPESEKHELLCFPSEKIHDTIVPWASLYDSGIIKGIYPEKVDPDVVHIVG